MDPACHTSEPRRPVRNPDDGGDVRVKLGPRTASAKFSREPSLKGRTELPREIVVTPGRSTHHGWALQAEGRLPTVKQ